MHDREQFDCLLYERLYKMDENLVPIRFMPICHSVCDQLKIIKSVTRKENMSQEEKVNEMYTKPIA